MLLSSRRHFIASTSALIASPLAISRIAIAQDSVPKANGPIYSQFPTQDPNLVKEMVGASHGKLERVQELLGQSPALAKAAYDWGFGDWETALGAASHVGSREIALLLIANGARPDLFTFAMLGQLETVKAYLDANPGMQRIHGPHGLTLLHHARKGGESAKAVVEHLEELGDADAGYTTRPLTDEEKQAYAGDYAFGNEPSHAFKVNLDKNGWLTIMRQPDGSRCRMFYQGNHEFHPAGAPAVRIRFEVSVERATGLTIVDGKPSISAQRV